VVKSGEGRPEKGGEIINEKKKERGGKEEEDRRKPYLTYPRTNDPTTLPIKDTKDIRRGERGGLSNKRNHSLDGPANRRYPSRGRTSN